METPTSFFNRLEGVQDHAGKFPAWLVAVSRRLLAAGDYGESAQREWDQALEAAAKQSRRRVEANKTQGVLFGTPDLF